MKRLAALIFWFALIYSAHAQPVQQSGFITPTHGVCWTTNGVVQDCGTAAQPFESTGGVSPGPWCVNSGPVTGPYQAFCLNANTSTGGILSIQNFGGAPVGGISLTINGAAASLANVVLPTVNGDYACFNNATGTIVDCGTAPAGVVYGTSPSVVGHLATWNNTIGTLLNTAGTVTGGYIWSGDQFFSSGRPWCDVRSQGAKGDGSTDDTAAFQACVTIVETFASSGTVFVPASANQYCIKTGPVKLNAQNTRIIGASRNVQLSACNTDTSILELSNSQEEAQELFLVGHGGGDGAPLGTFGATKSVLILDQNCVDCYIAHLQSAGGLHAIQWNSGFAIASDVIASKSYGSAIIYFEAAAGGVGGGVAAGWLGNINPDQTEYPAGTPAAGTTYNARANSTGYSTGAVVSYTCQDGNSYFLQATSGGTSGTAALTCQYYGRNITDGTVTWQLAFPNPYYHYQLDSGTSEIFLHDSDTGGGTAGIAMTNTIGGGTAPGSFRGVNLNGGNGYQANFWGHDGSDMELTNINTNGCIKSGCGNYYFSDNFTGHVTISGGNCGASPFCAVISAGNNYSITGVVGTSLTTGPANLSGTVDNVAMSGIFPGATSFTNTSSGTHNTLQNSNLPLVIANGGTNASTQQAALNNIAPTPTRAGDIIYWNGSNWVNFAGNNSGTACFQENSSGVPSFAACGSGSPGGSNTQLQYNNSSAFGGISGATTNGTTVTFSSGSLILAGSGSGTTVLNAASVASGTATLPANTGTIAETNLSQTFSAAQTVTPTQAANTSVDGLILADTTAASSGNQQYSPRLKLTGQGWKTNSVAASQTVDWIIENQPVQGTANPTSNLVMSSQINGGGYSAIFSINNSGVGYINQNATAYTDSNSAGIVLNLADNAGSGWLVQSFANSGVNSFIRFDGTNASRSALLSGDEIARFGFGGATSSSTVVGSRAQFRCNAAENWSSTAYGTYCSVVTTITGGGSPSPTEMARFQPSGGLSIGNANVGTNGGAGILVATGATLTTLSNTATTSAVCYNTGTGVLTYDGTIGTCNTSTRRVKHDIHPLQISALDAVMKMQPVSFYYNADQHTPGQQLGFVAEDLQKIDPRLVALDKDGQPFAIRFLGPMFSYVVGAIHQLKADNDNLRREITGLKRKIK